MCGEGADWDAAGAGFPAEGAGVDALDVDPLGDGWPETGRRAAGAGRKDGGFRRMVLPATAPTVNPRPALRLKVEAALLPKARLPKPAPLAAAAAPRRKPAPPVAAPIAAVTAARALPPTAPIARPGAPPTMPTCPPPALCM